MSHPMRFLSVLVLASALTACGGGGGDSSSSGSLATVNTGSNTGGSTNTGNNSNNTAVITTQCAEANSTVTVNADGCVTSGTSPQTAICVTSGTTKTLKMLSGTNKTYADVVNGGSSFSGNSITLNGKKFECA